MSVKHAIRTKDGGEKTVQLTVLKAIRAHCLECVGWSPSDVEYCTSKLCPLFPYRCGKDPSRKGKGNADSLNKNTKKSSK
jgi:hypothetical protein